MAKPNHGNPCRHCDRTGNLDRKGLCRRCYRNKAICALYPARTSYTQGHGVGNHARPLPPRPCRHAPGTEGKVAELERRAAMGMQLFHPGDDGGDPELGGCG